MDLPTVLVRHAGTDILCAVRPGLGYHRYQTYCNLPLNLAHRAVQFASYHLLLVVGQEEVSLAHLLR